MKKILLIVTSLIVIFIAVVVVLTVTQSKYSPIAFCYPSDRLIEKSPEYTDHIPLTANGFKKLVMDDTMHYKIVVIYSYCCGPCREYMRDIYIPIYKTLDTSEYKMYFVLDNCGSLPWNADYMREYGIEDLYYFRDDDSMFYEKTRYNLENIINYVTQPKIAFNSCSGLPKTLLIDKDGNIKQLVEVYNNTVVITPYDLWNMVNIDYLTINDLNYDKIDTNVYDSEYPIDLSMVDTVSFRTYKPKTKQMRYCTPDGVCM